MCIFRNVIILIYYAFYFILCYFNCYSVTNPSDISEGGILNQILLAHCCAGWVDPPPTCRVGVTHPPGVLVPPWGRRGPGVGGGPAGELGAAAPQPGRCAVHAPTGRR